MEEDGGSDMDGEGDEGDDEGEEELEEDDEGEEGEDAVDGAWIPVHGWRAWQCG